MLPALPKEDRRKRSAPNVKPQTTPSFVPASHPLIAQNLKKIERYKENQTALMVMSDQSCWSEYGCGRYQSSLTANPPSTN
ncbi:hypothetical protein ABIA58_002490 [Pseudomonas frederiksbergensis]